MSTTASATSSIEEGESGNWIETLARVGYAAKGVVYVIIGAIAIELARGDGGDAVGPSGAVESMRSQPFGQFLIGAIAAGLLCYAVWRFVQAAKDPENKGSDTKGIVTRIGYVCSGIAYTGVAIEAIRSLVSARSSGGGGEDGVSHWTGKLMGLPFGKWLVVAAGLAMLGAGLYQLYRGYSAEFKKLLKSEEMSETELTWGTRLGRVGFAARGVVYLVIGSFLAIAGWQSNPQQAKGIGGALEYLTQASYGPWLLGTIAVGLIAYGIFSTAVLARYRRILAN